MSLASLAVLAGIVAGQSRAAPTPTDLYGDPLPDGAVLRLGSARLKSDAEQMFFTPDGRTLITLESGRIVKRWGAEDGRLRQVFALPTPAWMPQALSPDGSLLAGGNDQQGMTIWDVASGTPAAELASGVCNFAAFSPDGRTLATCGWDNNTQEPRLRFWDARTWAKLPSPDTKYEAFGAAFSPDGAYLAWSMEGEVICVNVASGKEAWRRRDGGWGAQTAFSPGGGPLAVRVFPGKSKEKPPKAGDPSEIRFLNPADGKPIGRDPLPCPGDLIALAYSPDGTALAWRTPREIVVWDLKAGKPSRTLPIRGGAWSGVLFAFAPDRKTITALVGRTLHRWDLSTGKELYPDVSGRGHNGDIQAAAWSPDGKVVATMSEGGSDPSLRLWDAATDKLLRTLPVSDENWFPWCIRLAFTPDGKRLLAAGCDGILRCWDVAAEKEVWTGALPDPAAGRPRHLDRIHLTADGKRVIALSLDRNGSWGPAVEVAWDAATGKRLRQSAVPMASGSDIYSPEGRFRTIWTGDVYDVDTGAVRQTLKARYPIGNRGHDDIGAYSPDGALFAGLLQDLVTKGNTVEYVCRGIQVWETATGKRVTLIPEKAFGRLAFAPDGRTLLVVGDDSIRAWDAVTGEEVYRQPVADHLLGGLHPIAVSPDGRRLVVGCDDTTAVVWDISSALRRPREAARFSEAERDAAWNDLAADDASDAYAAIARLAAHLAEAAALPRARLRPAAGVPRDRVNRLIAALNDDDFEVRESASKELADLADQIEPALREAAASPRLSAEQRGRVLNVLRSMPAAPPRETLRGLRAVRALAWAGTPEARAVLESLADGAADAPLTREARAALDRWPEEK